MLIMNVVAAVIRRGNSVLLCTRPPDKPPVGREFPGGKIEPGETPEQALRRELLEELSLTSEVGALFTSITVEKADKSIRIAFYETSISPSSEIVPREGQTFDFFPLDGPEPEQLLAPDLPVWRELRKRGI